LGSVRELLWSLADAGGNGKGGDAGLSFGKLIVSEYRAEAMVQVTLSRGGNSVSIVRVGLAETKNFAEGYDAIFGKKKAVKKKPARSTPKKKTKAKKR
jgi:hypothetical protein